MSGDRASLRIDASRSADSTVAKEIPRACNSAALFLSFVLALGGVSARFR
ncbi:MAG: hypothetical protein O8C63_06025 [Candidatus Methanoperedens sp.]|nr:hypothetical protein [Candidatus Methanoperedens sp.]